MLNEVWIDLAVWTIAALGEIQPTKRLIGFGEVWLKTGIEWVPNIRAADREIARHPPADDPSQSDIVEKLGVADGLMMSQAIDRAMPTENAAGFR